MLKFYLIILVQRYYPVFVVISSVLSAKTFVVCTMFLERLIALYTNSERCMCVGQERAHVAGGRRTSGRRLGATARGDFARITFYTYRIYCQPHSFLYAFYIAVSKVSLAKLIAG